MEVGVQTTNPETLRAIGRDNDWPKLAENVKLLLAGANMHLHLDLIAGLPYEDLQSFANSFNAVYALRPHMLQLGFLKVLPGTVMAGKAEEYGVVHMPEPPYEVLATKFLGYEEMVLLKILSDVFDLTYNSNLFEQTLNFLVTKEKQGPFSFYRKLTEWWRQQKLFGSGHSASHTAELLYKFASATYPEDEDIEAVREVLRFDILLRQKNWQPSWLGWHSEKNYEVSSKFWRDELAVRQYLPEFCFKNWRLLKQQYALEEFDINPLTFKQEKCWILVDYANFKTQKINLFS